MRGASRVSDLVRRVPPAAWLGAIVAVSAGLRAWAATSVPVPWIPVDETIYARVGVDLWRHGSLEILGGPTPFYSFVYPAFAGLPLVLGGLDGGYTALRVLQAISMSLAAVPVYFWARRLAPARPALAAAALAVCVPGLAYAGLVLTEAVYYPLLAATAAAASAALARPTRANQAIVVALLLVLCATRLQAIVLLPAFVASAGLLAVFERRREPLVRLLPSFAALAAAALAWAGWRLASGKALLGAYEAAAESSYGAGAVLRSIVEHAGDLVLLTLVAPACALGVLFVESARGREPSREVRATVALTACFAAAVVLQVGLFATAHVGYVAERNLFPLAPLLFVCLAAWLGKGAPRPWIASTAAALVAVGLVLALRVDRFAVEGALPFALTGIPIWRHFATSSEETREAIVYGAAAIGAVAFALVPRRLALLLPVVAAVCLVAASVEASRYVADVARTQQTRFLGPEPRWIDRAASAPVAYLYDGDRDWDAVWENVFWNERLDAVFDLPETFIVGPLPQHHVDVRDDGTLVRGDGRPVAERAIVASTGLTFDGTQVAETPQQLPGQAGLRLWRLEGSPRISTWSGGRQPNGDVYGGGTAWMTVYDCRRGRLRLTLLVKEPQTVEIRRDRAVWRRLSFPEATIWRGVVPAAPGPGQRQCSFEVAPSGLLGSTVFQFERS